MPLFYVHFDLCYKSILSVDCEICRLLTALSVLTLIYEVHLVHVQSPSHTQNIFLYFALGTIQPGVLKHVEKLCCCIL